MKIPHSFLFLILWSPLVSAAPLLESFTITPSTIDVTSGSQEITLRAETSLSDPNEGAVRFVQVIPQGLDRFLNISSGIETDNGQIAPGIFEWTYTWVPFDAPGTFPLQVILTADENFSFSNNGDTALPAGATTELVIVNTGTVDRQPPTLDSLSFSPETALRGIHNERITTTLSLSDNLAGVNMGSIFFYQDADETNLVRNFFFSDFQRIDGDSLNGTYQFEVALNDLPEITRLYYRVNLRDQTGNFQTFGDTTESDNPPPAGTEPLLVENGNRPLNDSAFDRIILESPTPQTIQGTTLNATRQVDETGTEPATVWWRWEAASTGIYRARFSAGGTTNILRVLTGTDLAMQETLVTSSGGEAIFTAQRFSSYFFQVGGPGEAFEFLLEDIGVPNDLFVQRLSLPETIPSSLEQEIILASAEENEPGLEEGADSSIWFNWKSPALGMVQLSLAGGSFGERLKVYSGFGLTSLTELARSESKNLTFEASLGQDYRIQVLAPTETGGNLVLTVTAAGDLDFAPTLEALTFTPQTVDITTGEQTVMVRAVTRDDGGAVKSFQVIPQIPNRFISGFNSAGELQTDGSTVFEFLLTIPPFLPSGDYSLRIILTDSANHRITLRTDSGPTLPAAVTPQLTITNNGLTDLSAPVLEAISFSPTTIRRSALPQIVTVTVDVTDEPAGFSNGNLRFYGVEQNGSSSVDATFFGDSQRISGDDKNGRYQFEITIDEAPEGARYYARFQATDRSRLTSSTGDAFTSLDPFPDGSPILEYIDDGDDPFGAWLLANPDIPANFRSPTDDPDRDGLPNALEFFLGLDPLADSSQEDNAPKIIFENGMFGLQVKAPAVNLALGNSVTPKAQVSTNAEDWTDITAPTPDNNTLKFMVPYDAATPKFMRFVVELAP